MKKIFLSILLAGLVISTSACENKNQKNEENDLDRSIAMNYPLLYKSAEGVLFL